MNDFGNVGDDARLEDRIRRTLVAVADTIDDQSDERVPLTVGDSSGRPQRRRMLAAVAAVAVVVVAGAGLFLLPRLDDSAPADLPQPARTDGVIDDPFEVDLDPWRTGAPPWPPQPSGPYVGVVVDSIPSGWSIVDETGSHHLIGSPSRDGSWSWSILLTSPTGRTVALSTSDAELRAAGRSIEVRGTTGRATGGQISWRELDTTVSISSFPDEQDDGAEVLELVDAIELSTIERLPGWVPSEGGIEQGGEALLTGRIDGDAWELRATDHDMSMLLDGRSVSSGGTIGEQATFAVSAMGNGVIAFGFAPVDVMHLIATLSDGVTVSLPVVPSANGSAWAVPIPVGLDVVTIDFHDQSGDRVHRMEAPPIATPVIGATYDLAYRYDRPDGVALLPSPRTESDSLTCTAAAPDEFLTFDAAPGIVTTTPFAGLTIEVDRRNGVAIVARYSDGTVVRGSSHGDFATMTLADPELEIECGTNPDPTAPMVVDVEEVRSTDPELSAALDLALSDRRLVGFLADHPHSVRDVRRDEIVFDDTRGPEGIIVVEVQLEDRTGDAGSHYPLDACTPAEASQPVTGVVWLVEGLELYAVSPIWGGADSCFGTLS